MNWFDRNQYQLVYPTVEHYLTWNLKHNNSQTTFVTLDYLH